MQSLLLGLRGVVLMVLVGLMGCSQASNFSTPMNLSLMAQPSVTDIGEILQQPRSEQQVSLQGRVTKQVPLLDAQVYELEDASGKILVLTQDQMPALGTELTIEGRLLFKSIPIEGQELGSVYVEEVKRL